MLHANSRSEAPRKLPVPGTSETASAPTRDCEIRRQRDSDRQLRHSALDREIRRLPASPSLRDTATLGDELLRDCHPDALSEIPTVRSRLAAATLVDSVSRLLRDARAPLLETTPRCQCDTVRLCATTARQLDRRLRAKFRVRPRRQAHSREVEEQASSPLVGSSELARC